MTPRNTKENILARINKNGPSGCWLSGHKPNAHGYCPIAYQGKYYRAHRLIYTFIKGTIPEGLDLDHLCRNRACCNPDHLEPVTERENALRGIGPTAINSRKTHCTRGHALTGDNVRTTSQGGRECQACVKFVRATNPGYLGKYRAYKYVWHLKNSTPKKRHNHNKEYDQYWLHYYAMKYGVTLPVFEESIKLPEAA